MLLVRLSHTGWASYLQLGFVGDSGEFIITVQYKNQVRVDVPGVAGGGGFCIEKLPNGTITESLDGKTFSPSFPGMHRRAIFHP
jgi:hypothetical protein